MTLYRSWLEKKTDLTKLKYGLDKPGGGDSGQPYINTPFPENANTAQKIAIEAARFGFDFPIRGGLSSITNSATDLIRIGKFFTDAPRGPLFIAKQVGLQLMNPKIETGKVLGVVENTRFYNLGVNTLSQVGVNAFGKHFNRHGLGPTEGTSALLSFTINDILNIGSGTNEFGNYYYNTIKDQTPNQNRLVLLYNTKISTSPSSRIQGVTLDANIFTLNQKGISLDNNELLRYNGGPDSFLGLGQTVIRRYENTNLNNAGKSVIGNDNYSVFSFNDYKKQVKGSEEYFSSIRQDFRKNIANKNNASFLTSTDYLDPQINIESRIGIGNPGKPTRNRSDYSIPDKDTQDKINMLPLIKIKDGNFQISVKDGSEKNTLDRDLIKFRFEDINNDNPTETTAIIFRAFLENISDGHSSEWNSVKYNGRGENFYIYNGFTRRLSFSFKIAAQSREEMKPLYQKLNYLASTLTPDYRGNFMRGNITRLTIGDYIWRQPGIINSLNLTIPNESPWEIALNEPEFGSDKKMYELPHVLEASVDFTPIYDFLPKKSPITPIFLPNNSNTIDSTNANSDRWLHPIGNVFNPNESKADNTI